MYLRHVGVLSVFARGFNVLATGGGCTDFIVHEKILSCGVLRLLEVSVSAILCHGSLLGYLPRYSHLSTPVLMLRFGDCRGVQPLRTGRLVCSLPTMQIWATRRQGVAQIGRSSIERFATFWGMHSEFGTT